MSKRGRQILWLIILCGWIALIFSDAVNSTNSEKEKLIPTQEIQIIQTHNSANEYPEVT